MDSSEIYSPVILETFRYQKCVYGPSVDTSVRVNYTVVLEDSWKRDLDADFTNLAKTFGVC